VENDSESGEDESASVERNQPTQLQHQTIINGEDPARPRKRRHRDGEDDIEGAYMQRIAQEEAKEDAQRHQDRLSKRQKVNGDANTEAQYSDGDGDEQADSEPSSSPRISLSPPPQHETAAANPSSDSVEQATRTVFLANVSTTAITSKSAYTTLTTHLSSHLPSLAASTPPHKIASLRFRSTPYATSSIPKKAAFAKKDIMDATTKSTNAYVVYTTALAARETVKKLNGTVVLNRHLRVDSVAHPAATDHRRCVFVGNLGFVDDESAIRAAEDQENGVRKVRKQKEPADVEEGLWRQFENAGSVESVRVVRDKTTRVGKGFAYVQFKVCRLLRQLPEQYSLTFFRTSTLLSARFSTTPSPSHPSSPALSASPVQRTSPKRPPTAQKLHLNRRTPSARGKRASTSPNLHRKSSRSPVEQESCLGERERLS